MLKLTSNSKHQTSNYVLVVLVVVVEPRHHSTEFFADLFERMFSVLTAHSEEVSAATGFVFEEPIFGEGAGLDVVQDFFHGFLRFLGYDTRTSGVIAIFSGVADGFAHLSHSAFIHEVDDQFHFMEGFKVSDFRLITSFAEGFETVGDQLADAAAEDCLFTEEVCFRFFLEGRLDDAGTRAADAAGVSQSDIESFARSVLFDSEYVRNTAAFCESTANEVARAFRSDRFLLHRRQPVFRPESRSSRYLRLLQLQERI